VNPQRMPRPAAAGWFRVENEGFIVCPRFN
jgi:hypothetical protein